MKGYSGKDCSLYYLSYASLGIGVEALLFATIVAGSFGFICGKYHNVKLIGTILLFIISLKIHEINFMKIKKQEELSDWFKFYIYIFIKYQT